MPTEKVELEFPFWSLIGNRISFFAPADCPYPKSGTIKFRYFKRDSARNGLYDPVDEMLVEFDITPNGPCDYACPDDFGKGVRVSLLTDDAEYIAAHRKQMTVFPLKRSTRYTGGCGTGDLPEWRHRQ